MDIYVVDTSALLRDEHLLEKIQCGVIVLHTTVLEELDNLKQRNTTRGEIARSVIHYLFKLKGRGNFEKGLRFGNKVIRFDDREPDTSYLRFGFSNEKNDNLILCVAKEIKEETGKMVVMLTGDRMLSLKAAYDHVDVELIFAGKTAKNKTSPYKNSKRKMRQTHA